MLGYDKTCPYKLMERLVYVGLIRNIVSGFLFMLPAGGRPIISAPQSLCGELFLDVFAAVFSS